MYKDPKGFKGFEAWIYNLYMNIKMHFHIFIIVFTIYMLVPLFWLAFFDRSFFHFFLSILPTLNIVLWPKAFWILFKYIFHIFVLALPVWLLYPVLLKFFQAKAQNIMTDEHVRGTKIISDDELARIVWKDIQDKMRR